MHKDPEGFMNALYPLIEYWDERFSSAELDYEAHEDFTSYLMANLKEIDN